MSHRYFKVPPHLALKMNISNMAEKRLKDGNYLAVYEDMAMFYKEEYKQIANAQSMGCLALTAKEMTEEFLGIVTRPLPKPTDPRFFTTSKLFEDIIKPKDSVAEQTETTSEESQPDMVFTDEDGEPIVNVYFSTPEIEDVSQNEDTEEEEPEEEGGA